VQSGLAHGNLNLDSLLIDEQQFFIYVCDLAVWERLFDPSTAEIVNPSPSQDLVALGYVGFYLLAGATHNPIDNQPLDPQDEQHWPPVDFALKAFLLRLMGFSIPFENAEVARQALLKLPPAAPVVGTIVPVVPEEDEEQKIKTSRPLLFLLGTLGLLLLGTLAWFLIPKPNETTTASDELPLRYIKDVSAVPSGKFTYTGELGGRWTDLQTQKNLVSPGQTLPQELTKRQPKLKLIYQPESSDEQAIQKVISGEKEFAVTSLVNPVPVELEYKEVAYDGLVVVVAFSYSKRENSLPPALNGKITFEQLRKLYTGEIANWKDLGGPDLPVKLYMPDDTEAVRIFEQRVLKDADKINAFKNLQRKPDQAALVTNSWIGLVTRVPNSREMLQKVIQDFEKADSKQQIGAIAFSRLSQVFGQCSVYPLALVEEGNSPVQPLIQDNGQPVNPTTDLCNDKGSYHPNVQVFKDRTYPLTYPLAVVYPRDNSRPPVGVKFADMLRTQEGQQLLSKTGLVPLYPVTLK
jgi:ABC-type phosphate transport system substrate-binding protein